jgi:hypothetical protein
MREIVIDCIEEIDPKQDAPAIHVVFTEKPGEAIFIETLAGTHNDNCAQCNAVNVRWQRMLRFAENDMLARELLGNERWWDSPENTILQLQGYGMIVGKTHMLAVTDGAGSRMPAHIRVGSAACFFGLDVHYLKPHYFPMQQVTAIYRRIL